ncbi:MAG: hypothetical protein DRH57_08510 [Candidatus Cloacimonadota bacterium]|nr:MAG: hypothetical protein DRH57_08510 [Candidatus Cloacimonadota bacterium]
MTILAELKEKSDEIALCDDRLREIAQLLKTLESEKKTLTQQKDHKVWQLQDRIDELCLQS